MVRASDRCTEGHEFDSRRGLRFFFSDARDMLNIPSFLEQAIVLIVFVTAFSEMAGTGFTGKTK